MINATSSRRAFLFPGQGSYSPALLREIYTEFPRHRDAFEQADRVCRRVLGFEVSAAFTTGDGAEHDRLCQLHRDLDQVGIFLAAYLVAQVLREFDIEPDLMLGHSFGEIAALASAGVLSLTSALGIVCQRVLTLQTFARQGKMMAVTPGSGRVEAGIEALRRSNLSIAVTNHPRQMVVSGSAEDLQALSVELNRIGVSTSLLASRYPFHSPLLESCVAPFRIALRAHEFRSEIIPVFLGTENKMLTPDCDLPAILARQFTQPLDFHRVIRDLVRDEGCSFIECGANGIVTKIVRNIVEDDPRFAAVSAAPKEGLKHALTTLAGFRKPPTRQTSGIHLLVRKAASAARDLEGTLAEVAALTGQFPSAQETPPASTAPAIRPARDPADAQPASSAIPVREPPMPIAIVAMGCVLPGAGNAEQYWQNVLQGVSGIVDLAQDDPVMAADYLNRAPPGEMKIRPDKTYTLLHGSVGDIRLDEKLLAGAYTAAQFDALTRGERILALAFAQSKCALRSKMTGRMQCILGATADGSAEYDEARFIQSVERMVDALDEPTETRAGFADLIRRRWAEESGRLTALPQHNTYQEVCRRVFGTEIDTYVIDAACSSSLYSIDQGMKVLGDGDADLVIAGGVFAPGPANNTLFAQFRGLTGTQSRPFDETADGVVFGDGAAIVILKRLPDALADGDDILGVIRGIGLSSDGKSPAANVPQSKGQGLAIRRAYERSGVDPATIQYIEAHATATPVGDAVEFGAIASAIPPRPDGTAIQLGSVKALIGHTGWAAGAASLIKLCKAIQHQTIPAQHHFARPNPQIHLERSAFAISTQNQPWPKNSDALPRRSAINGFGFGGTDAHLVLEEFDQPYHAALCSAIAPPIHKVNEFVVVGYSALFPQPEVLAGDTPTATARFRRDLLKMPKRQRLLPDVVDHMDPSQFLALMAADASLSLLPEAWRALAAETAVVLGIESKTERGARAGERIFKDRLRRLVGRGSDTIPRGDTTRLIEKLIAVIDGRNAPSGPYTLPGLMPNIATGRVANLFDINGPNVVVDKGRHSLAQALTMGATFLRHDNCKLVLAGALHAAASGSDDSGEACLLLAITTHGIAEKHNFPVLGILDLAASAFIPRQDGVRLGGAEGAIEIAAALKTAARERQSIRIALPAPAPEQKPNASVTPEKAAVTPSAAGSKIYNYVQGTPISLYRAELVPTPAKQPPVSLKSRRILFITDQPKYWLELEESGALQAFRYSVVCPVGAGLRHGIELDPQDDNAIRASLDAMVDNFDVILALRTLERETADGFLETAATAGFPFLDLLFTVCRSFYDRINRQQVSVLSVCLDAVDGKNLRPYSGMVAGLLKSVARECRDSVVRALSVEHRSFLNCLAAIEVELGQGPDVGEICIRGGTRYTFQLAKLGSGRANDKAYLNESSVVVATGGGRGVTAVLVQELLARFRCKVIAIGRTDLATVPADVLAMSDEEFEAHQSVFYTQQMKLGKNIRELKQLYAGYGASRELHHIQTNCSSLPGSFEYICANITDKDSVDACMADIADRYGRVDLILHGAGIQISKATPKKSLKDFKTVVNTKLASLGLLYAASHRNQSAPPHVHILTSAFSYMGNDGQPDYGAANEALNRLAVNLCNAPQHGVWSSMAWLGWAGIGMTRGSEYAALAAHRGLRGVTRDEGRAIFADAIAGAPAAPAIIQIAAGEAAHYGVVFAPSQTVETLSKRASTPIKNAANDADEVFHAYRDISLKEQPFLADHLVNGVPTLPGAYLIAEIGTFAMQMRPKLKVASFENAVFHRFVKLAHEGSRRLRFEGVLREESDGHSFVQVKVYSDFVHQSGVLLQKDVLQTEVCVRLAKTMNPAAPCVFDANTRHDVSLDDPYVIAGSPVQLKGRFRTMSNISSGSLQRRADYLLDPPSDGSREPVNFFNNLMMMDSLWRFGAIARNADNSMPVYVPVKCDAMKVYFDFAEFSRGKSLERLTFCGANPRGAANGDQKAMNREQDITIGPVSAVDTAGRVLLVVEGGICRRYGTVSRASA